jgi:hypothetical protein
MTYHKYMQREKGANLEVAIEVGEDCDPRRTLREIIIQSTLRYQNIVSLYELISLSSQCSSQNSAITALLPAPFGSIPGPSLQSKE